MSETFYETIITYSLQRSLSKSFQAVPDKRYILKSITFGNAGGLLRNVERNEPGMLESYDELMEILHETM